jgi:hypothetical protein
MNSTIKNQDGLDAKGNSDNAESSGVKTSALDQLRAAMTAPLGLSVMRRFDDFSVAFCGQSADGLRFYFCGFAARQKQPVACRNFPTISERDAYAEGWCNERLTASNEMNAFKAERKQLHTLKAGDILYTSWGYEQTNVEFYEVMAVRGSVVDLQELQKDKGESSHGMQGECMPIRGQYRGELIKGKRPNGRNCVRLDSCSSGYPWDGRPVAWSSYA